VQRIIELIKDEDDIASNAVDKSWEYRVERRLGLLASKGIVISKLRTSDLDITLGIQQLSDIAVRALSQAINDPHTAIQCLDTLSALLSALGVMDLGELQALDRHGHVRACAPRRSFSFLLSLLDTIRRYGSSDLGVCRRGLRLFGDLASILIRAKRLDRVVPTLAQLQEWMAVSRANFAEGSAELANLQELYDFLVVMISEAEELVLKKQIHADTDLQFLNTTLEPSMIVAATTPKGKAMLNFMESVESARSKMSERSKSRRGPRLAHRLSAALKGLTPTIQEHDFNAEEESSTNDSGV